MADPRESLTSLSSSSITKSTMFLTLPLEIRLIIYRLLLWKDAPIVDLWDLGLSPAILCTCRQIRLEASPVLYVENTFCIKMLGAGFEPSHNCDCPYMEQIRFVTHHTEFCGLRDFYEEAVYAAVDSIERPLVYIQKMKRFHVDIKLDSATQVSQLRREVSRVVRLLSNVEEICYLQITLHGNNFDTRPFSDLLKNFDTLREVRKVTFKGIRPNFECYLTDVMTSSLPASKLPSMLAAVEEFMEGETDYIEQCYSELKDAAHSGDRGRFKKLRVQLVEDVTFFRAQALDNIYDHDAKGSPFDRDDSPASDSSQKFHPEHAWNGAGEATNTDTEGFGKNDEDVRGGSPILGQ